MRILVWSLLSSSEVLGSPTLRRRFSHILLPLFFLITVFGMNVGGVPWTEQRDPALRDGFRNVMLLCVGLLFLALLCFVFPALYKRLAEWQRKRVMQRSWSLNRKSFLKRTPRHDERGGYLRIWNEVWVALLYLGRYISSILGKKFPSFCSCLPVIIIFRCHFSHQFSLDGVCTNNTDDCTNNMDDCALVPPELLSAPF